MVRSQPSQRLSIITDFYRLLLDGFPFIFFHSHYNSVLLEVLMNSRSELLACMMKEGLLHVIGDVIVSETDPLVLVC